MLSKQEGQWSVVQQVGDLNGDDQAWVNGYLQKVDYGDGRTLTLAPAPVQFNGTPPTLRPAPEHAAQTMEILHELGLDSDAILGLKQRGVVS